ncbi:MAG: hypothetical protein DU489_06945 [Nitrosomonas sp.]|uniref:hypothetical protein n=1 Tax=Nitrosomonas sp. TaxID=42353 RepID=UPI0032EEFB3C
MEKINFASKNFQIIKNNRGSQRGEMLDKFLEKLNLARKGDGYKLLTHSRLSKMLSHIPTEDLHAFYRQCETAKIPFGAFFYWSLKVKK